MLRRLDIFGSFMSPSVGDGESPSGDVPASDVVVGVRPGRPEKGVAECLGETGRSRFTGGPSANRSQGADRSQGRDAGSRPAHDLSFPSRGTFR